MARGLTSRVREVTRGFRRHREFKAFALLYSTAYRLANSELADADAVEQLRADARSDPEAARALLGRSRSGHASYIEDRIERLVAAALDGNPVAPMPREHAAERELGRESIAAAFRELETRVPKLAQLRREAEAWGAAHPDVEPSYARTRQLGKLAKRAKLLVGPNAANVDNVCGSPTAFGVARAYLEMLLGDTECGTPETPYFQFAIAPRTVSFSLDFSGGDFSGAGK